MDTKEIYISRLPQHTSDDSPYLSSDLSKPALSSRSEPPPPGENGGLRCTVLYLPGPRKRISEDSLRTHKPNFPLMDSWEIHYYGVLQSFRLGALGLPTPWILFLFSSSFSLCLDYNFLKGELAKDEAPFLSSSLFFCCMCATVVYPPNPPRALACTKGNPDEVFCITFESRRKKKPWEGLLLPDQSR